MSGKEVVEVVTEAQRERLIAEVRRRRSPVAGDLTERAREWLETLKSISVFKSSYDSEAPVKSLATLLRATRDETIQAMSGPVTREEVQALIDADKESNWLNVLELRAAALRTLGEEG